jgi:hypothetical protein
MSEVSHNEIYERLIAVEAKVDKVATDTEVIEASACIEIKAGFNMLLEDGDFFYRNSK